MRGFAPARNFKTTPLVASLPYANGETFTKGALLSLIGGALEEYDGDVPVSYVALEGVARKLGHGTAYESQTTVKTAVENKVSAARVDDDTLFSARGVDEADATVAPVAATHLGNSYGVKKVNGVWVVDFDETEDVVVRVEGIVDATTERFLLVKFLAVEEGES